MALRNPNSRSQSNMLFLLVTLFTSFPSFFAGAKILGPNGSTEASGQRPNPFGIGLVSEGSVTELDLAQRLVGDQGWVLLTLAGVDNTTTAPQQTWITSVQQAFQRNLSVVVRLSPPWGQSSYRDEADDTSATPRTQFATLATAFTATVSGLLAVVPKNGRLYVQVGNEPDLCYEWFCARPSPTPLGYTVLAAEYAFFFSQTAAKIAELNDARVWVSSAPLAPGGNIACGCCGSQSCGAADKPGITGLTFMQAMLAAVPKVFEQAQFLASHSYPASGVGFGFNVPFPSALPGLLYYEQELKTIGKDIPVLITETGWATSVQGDPPCSEQNKADWTVAAYTQVWNDTRILGVMPFMLQDPVWGDKDGFEYVRVNGQLAPVFSAVVNQRRSQGYGPMLSILLLDSPESTTVHNNAKEKMANENENNNYYNNNDNNNNNNNNNNSNNNNNNNNNINNNNTKQSPGASINSATPFHNIVGFHLGPGGDQNNVGDYLTQLDKARVPFSIKNVDAIGFLGLAVQLKNASGVNHQIIWRSTNTDVPPYTLASDAAAVQHWALVKKNMPTQLLAMKDLIWIEVINEPDQTKCAWLSNFSIAISKLAVAEGWHILNYAWSTGTPFVGASHPSCWATQEAGNFLKYAASSGGRVGVALHEYSNSQSITNEWGWLLGRYHFLIEAIDTYGLAKGSIPIAITEWGWEGCHVKLPPSEGIADINMVMRGTNDTYGYANHPEVMAAMMWYLGPWNCPVSNEADKLVLPVANYTVSTYVPTV